MYCSLAVFSALNPKTRALSVAKPQSRLRASLDELLHRMMYGKIYWFRSPIKNSEKAQLMWKIHWLMPNVIMSDKIQLEIPTFFAYS